MGKPSPGVRPLPLLLALLLPGFGPGGARAQTLEEFDYENLVFRGGGLEVGYIWPNTVRPAATYSLRVDLGYLGPGVRILPGLSYWSSELKAGEVERLAGNFRRSMERSLEAQLPPEVLAEIRPLRVDLGAIAWSDLSLGVDAQLVWSTPLGILTYVGAGVSAHLMDGSGELIDGTFVEDLLDTVTAGFGILAGGEYVARRWLRVFAEGRYTLLNDVRYPEVRGGVQLMMGPPAPGEADGNGGRP